MGDVTVLTPVYNGADVLDSYREQIYCQSTPPDQILLYDDGSTDETRHILGEWASRDRRVRVIGDNVNRGRGFARQRLIEEVKTEYVAWLDADDRWHPKTLETLLDEYHREAATSDAPFVICAPYYQISLRNGGARFVALPRTYVGEDYIRLARDKNSVAMLQCTLGRTADLVRVGFDDALNWSEDFDFFLRFLAAGGHIVPQRDQTVAVGYLHTMAGQDMREVIKAHDYLYEKNADFWPESRDVVVEKYTRRLRYVLYGCVVAQDGPGAETVFLEALEQLGADAQEADVRSGVRSVLKAYGRDSFGYVAFAHRWANRGKRLQCTPVAGGYRLSSTRTDKLRWKTIDGVGLEGDIVDEALVNELFLSGVGGIVGVERLDGGSRREFHIEALRGGRIGLMPKL